MMAGTWNGQKREDNGQFGASIYPHAAVVFDDDEYEEWMDAGFNQDAADEWRSIGCSPTEAEDWMSYSFTSDDASQWRRCFYPDAADYWRSNGFSYDEAEQWQETFRPDEAQMWSRDGFDYESARSWNENFSIREADELRTAGLTCQAATDWKERGFSPDETIALSKDGLSSVKTGDEGPWGVAKHVHEEQQGIFVVTGSNDNGIQLSAERNESMPEPLRREGGWYLNKLNEHILVWFAFIDECDDDDTKIVKRRFRDDFPDEYEQLTGKPLRKGQSRKRDQERFYLQHANDMISVWSSATYGEEMVQVTARRPSAPDEYVTYEIPTQEYYAATQEDKSSFGIVIDESRYRPIEEENIND
jgi:hypothetical protein